MEGNQTPLELAIKGYDRHTHSILRRSRRSKIPKTAMEKASPLHVSEVGTIKIEKIRERMNENTRERFDEVLKLTFTHHFSTPNSPPTHIINKKSKFQAGHAEQLVEKGVAEHSGGRVLTTNVPFTVVEERDGALRQRFILWTKDANEKLDRVGYQAYVPIEHVSHYLSAVNLECASARDIKTSFYQIEIPAEYRKYFRFTDENGEVYQLTRLPMGHCCAPEIMQTVTAVTAGDRGYVKPEFAVDEDIRVDVWVDNIRYTGPEVKVKIQTSKLDQVAAHCGITWKKEDTRDAVKEYTFIGVLWNHLHRTVTPSEKIVNKINSVDLEGPIRASTLESLGGRLMHASAISGVLPGSRQYWFGLKNIRRIINKLNKGKMPPEQEVKLARASRECLKLWVRDVQRVRSVLDPPAEVGMTAFVDASMEGWGGVLFNNHTVECTIVGGRWGPVERGLHINQLEAIAFRNVVNVLPPGIDGGRLDIFVDNTTVQGVARKKLCLRNRILNDAVTGAIHLLNTRRITYSLAWVSTLANPSDIPSRVDVENISELDVQKVKLATWRFFGLA